MRRALDLATRAIGLSDPNPRVGCVIVDAGGRPLGEGHTQQAGGAHAEVMALRDAISRGEDVRGATAYVTLEPCSHQGRTPPCAEALVRAQLGRVVVAIEDPNPLVAGAGIERLRSQGIAVDVGLMSEESRELNIGFHKRMTRGLPWVRVKVAMSLDGRTALENGASQWITGEAARVDGHAWRKRAGAILTGVGTVLRDDPRLDVRLVDTRLQPLRVVVDSKLSTSHTARILAAPGAVHFYTCVADLHRHAALRAAGADVSVAADEGGQVNLAAVLNDLARRGVNEVHVEAGHRLNGSLAHGGLVDEWLIYVAPRLLGAGPGIAALPTIDRIVDTPALAFHSVTQLTDDLRILARPLRQPSSA